MTDYTYVSHQPEIYGGKMFKVTPETGDPFLVSTATGESEIPALVEHHLNPPPPAPYPPPGPPVPTAEQQVLYDHENRVRTLEGLPPLSVADFIGKMSPT